MDIQTSRVLGILAASFTLLGAISTIITLLRLFLPNTAFNVFALGISGIIGIFGFLGFILFLLAMWGFSKSYAEKRIFNYPLYGLIILIVGFIVTMIILFAFLFSNLLSMVPRDSPPSVVQDVITSIFQTYFPPFIIVFGLIGLVNSVLNVLAFNLLGTK